MGRKIEYFTGMWCAPCQSIKPLINEIKSLYNIEIIDVDNNPEITAARGIRNVPTFIFYEDENEINRKIGTSSINKRMLLEFFKK